MSESAGKYTIKIKTELEGSGAQQAAKDVKDIGAQAEISHKSLREIERLLSKGGLGQIGEILRAAFNPVLLAGAGIVGILEQWHKRQEMIHEQNLKLITDAEEYADRHRKLAAAIQNQLLDSLNAAKIHVDHLHDSFDAAAEAAKLMTDHASNMAAAAERQADAQERIAQAEIALAVASGRITSGQGQEMRDAEELAAQKRKDAAENARIASDQARAQADAMRAKGGSLETNEAAIQTTKDTIAALKGSHASSVTAAAEAQTKFVEGFFGGYKKDVGGMIAAGKSPEEIQKWIQPFGQETQNRFQEWQTASRAARMTDPAQQEQHLRDLEREHSKLEAQLGRYDKLADAQDALAEQYLLAAQKLKEDLQDREGTQPGDYAAREQANKKTAAARFMDESRKNYPKAEFGPPGNQSQRHANAANRIRIESRDRCA